MIKSEYDLRDQILMCLTDTYARDVKGKGWYDVRYSKDMGINGGMCLQLVTDILAVFAYAHVDPENDQKQKYYGETMFNRIHNIIWTTFPGGSTAEAVAKDICKILNVEVDDFK